jgi:hypothetical protein
MGKTRKTHREKLIADLRRKVYSLEAQQPSFSQEKESKSIVNMPYHTASTTIAIKSHVYLTRDLFKTSILTGIIVLIQLILFFLLKNHILTLPIVKY